MSDRQRIAVVGTGVAGLTAAWLLARRHDVTLLEREPRVGGHTRTLTVSDGPDRGTPIDTGFIVMNHHNYPLFTRVLDQLKVELRDSDMSFSWHDPARGFAWCGTNLRGLFATPSSLVSPAHWGMIRDILRFNRRATDDLESGLDPALTLGDYVRLLGLGPVFRDRYLYAMGSAIWSSPPDGLDAFPATAFLHFFKNHGLLSVNDRPQWRYVAGGSRTYVEAMRATFAREPLVNAGVRAVVRKEAAVEVVLHDGRVLSFDQVVLAAHADESLAMLDAPTADERDLLGAWSYQPNEVVLHWDESVMPRRAAAWASWNFCAEPGVGGDQPVSVSYHMNRLQKLATARQYFVTLNRRLPLDPAKVIDRAVLTHPVFHLAALESQSRLPELNGTGRVWYCGSYFGYGFHEDAVRSAVELAARFGIPL